MTHTLNLHGWRPTPLNRLMRMHWAKRNRLIQEEKAVVAYEARAQEIPKAQGKRRVSLVIEHRKGRKVPDADALLKVMLDSLVVCGLLKDDGKDWLELGTVGYAVADRAGVVITLEDI